MRKKGAALAKSVFTLTILTFLLTATLFAGADGIVEPENDFYNQHRDECVYLGRSFVNAKYNSVSIKNEPDAHDDIGIIKNGETVYLEYSCLFDGAYWGMSQYRYNGWVKIDQLLVLYDYVAFEEDHFDEFYEYNGAYDELRNAGAAIAWPWPGSGIPLFTIESIDTEHFKALHVYMDDAGREWGFVPYYYGNGNIWVCLNDPLNRDTLATNPAPQPAVWETETFHYDIALYKNVQKSKSSMLIIIIIMVAALVAGTAILIKVFWTPQKTKPGGKGDD